MWQPGRGREARFRKRFRGLCILSVATPPSIFYTDTPYGHTFIYYLNIQTPTRFTTYHKYERSTLERQDYYILVGNGITNRWHIADRKTDCGCICGHVIDGVQF